MLAVGRVPPKRPLLCTTRPMGGSNGRKPWKEKYPPLDVITIRGRASVDLYGQQIGSRLEDITSFAKSVGGCPANISVGTARAWPCVRRCSPASATSRWAASSARQLRREGVSVDGLKTDKETADRPGAAFRWRAKASRR